MPLRDTSALDEWRQRVNPSPTVWSVVWEWVQGLDAKPFQAPSTPFPELSSLPEYELRTAEIPGSDGIEVFYRHEFASDEVDLIWIR